MIDVWKFAAGQVPYPAVGDRWNGDGPLAWRTESGQFVCVAVHSANCITVELVGKS